MSAGARTFRLAVPEDERAASVRHVHRAVLQRWAGPARLPGRQGSGPARAGAEAGGGRAQQRRRERQAREQGAHPVRLLCSLDPYLILLLFRC